MHACTNWLMSSLFLCNFCCVWVAVVVVGRSSSFFHIYCVHIIFPLFKLIRLICIFWSYGRCFFVCFSLLRSFFGITFACNILVRVCVYFFGTFVIALKHECAIIRQFSYVSSVFGLHNRIRLRCRFCCCLDKKAVFISAIPQHVFTCFSIVKYSHTAYMFSLHFQHLFSDYYFICIFDDEIETNGLQSTTFTSSNRRLDKKKKQISN